MWVWSLGWEDPLDEKISNSLQYCCLENPMDRGAWWATVHDRKELDMTERLSTHIVSMCTSFRGRIHSLQCTVLWVLTAVQPPPRSGHRADPSLSQSPCPGLQALPHSVDYIASRFLCVSTFMSFSLKKKKKRQHRIPQHKRTTVYFRQSLVDRGGWSFRLIYRLRLFPGFHYNKQGSGENVEVLIDAFL